MISPGHIASMNLTDILIQVDDQESSFEELEQKKNLFETEGEKASFLLKNENLDFLKQIFTTYQSKIENDSQQIKNRINERWLNSTRGKIQLFALTIFFPFVILTLLTTPFLVQEPPSSSVITTIGSLALANIVLAMLNYWKKFYDLKDEKKQEKKLQQIIREITYFKLILEYLDKGTLSLPQLTLICKPIKDYTNVMQYNLPALGISVEEIISILLDFLPKEERIYERWNKILEFYATQNTNSRRFKKKYTKFWKLINSKIENLSYLCKNIEDNTTLICFPPNSRLKMINLSYVFHKPQIRHLRV